uniref:Uncharacterized protein n=1 Tax=viral metagenome TaxID=1070528 RepID=A0A6C0AKL1_9ZZZZ
MPQCAAVRNRASFDQCPSDALKGVNLCGRHARAKDPILWATRNQSKILRFTRVQAVYRGWCVRKVLALAGPGVLRRKECVNDEDLVTTESKDRQHPFDYFGLEEAGKIWWFDFGSLWEWTIRSVAPTNPYTQVAIDHSVLARLRRLHLHRRRNRLSVPSPSRDLRENITRRWTVLAHIFRSYGFEDAHPQQFANLTHVNMRTMFRIFMDELEAVPKPNRRVLTVCTKAWLADNPSTTGYMINSLNLLTIALTDSRSYDIVFLLLSALYRC